MVSVVGEWFEGNMSGLGGIRVVWVVYGWFGWYMSGLVCGL